MSSGGRGGGHPSNRITRKLRRDGSPVNRREKPSDVRRARPESGEKSRNEHETAEEKEKDKDRKRKDINVLRSGKQIRSPRKTKELLPLDRKNINQRNDRKVKTESKEKVREKKNTDNIERHPLFQDNSRLAQLIAQITNSRDEGVRRIQAAQSFYDYIYDSAHVESLKRNCSNIFSALEEVFQERTNNDLKHKIVLCFGSIGHVLGIDCDKFFQWIFSKIPSAANDQLRVLYLRAISESVQIDVGKQVFYDTMPMIMASLQEVLENADSPELLLVILDIITIVAGDYPHIFAEYFRDTVDILVGWHIDTTQSEQLTLKTADCLISFHPYWVSDMRFSLTLLGQFLEDMEAYAEELRCITESKLEMEDAPSPHHSLPKLTALTRVFTTVVAGLGEFFSPGREAKITINYINDTVERIIGCVDICRYDFKFEKLLIAANDCLTALLMNLGSNINASCVGIVQFINNQLSCKHIITLTLLASAIHLIEKIIRVVGYSLPADVVPELIGENKSLMRYRCHGDSDIVITVLKIFQTLLSIRNMPLLEVIYKLLIKDLIFSYSIVVDSVDITLSRDLVKTLDIDLCENPERGEFMDVYDYYQIVVFDLVALAEIATFKCSVTGAWKVEPSSFDLLTKVLDPSDVKLAVHFPSIQFAILSTLYCHSQRCNNFVPTSNLKNPCIKESSRLIDILCKIIIERIGSSDVKCLCMTWLTDISLSIAALPSSIQKRRWNLTQLIDAIVVLSFDIDTNVSDAVNQCIIKIAKTDLLHSTSLGRLLAETLYHLADKEKLSPDKFKSLMSAFPADILACLPNSSTLTRSSKYLGCSPTSSVSCQNDIWLQCRKLMCSTSMGYLHSYGFKIIMQYLLTMTEHRDTSWAEHVYSMCQRLGKTTEPVAGELLSFQRFSLSADTTFPFNVSNFDCLQWFLLTWQAAEFCVLSRLRTPLGKALDTFQTIEGVLRELESCFKENNILEKYSKDNSEVDVNKRVSRQHELVKVTLLLLQFIEKLEKLMYNAYEGTATSLPPSIRPVRTFFRTNRSTCIEWLNRIHGIVCVLASLSGCTEEAIRSGFLWLNYLKSCGSTQSVEFEYAIITVVDSLLQLQCHESIQGILEWSKKSVGRNFFWLSGAATKAKGSLECAADLFKTGLYNYLSPDRLRLENVNDVRKPTVTLLTKDPVINADSKSVQFLIWQVTDCYLQLCDWGEVQEWNKQVNDLHKKFPSVEGLHPTIDHSYVKAMMKFEENDFAGVHEQLDMIPGATMSNIMQEQFPVLGAVKEEKDIDLKHIDGGKNFLVDNLTPQGMLYQSHVYLMQALTLYWTSGLNTLKGSGVGSLHSSAWETVDNLLSQAFKTAMIPLHSIRMTGSARSAAPFLMKIKAISAIRESLVMTDVSQDTSTVFMNVYGHSKLIDASGLGVSVLNEALCTTNYLQFHHSLHKKGWVGPSTNTDDKLPNIQTLQVMTAKLARKQGNKNLAESLLAKQLSIVDGKMYLAGGAQLKLKQLSASANSGKVVDPLSSVEILRESAKLKRTLGNNTEAIDVLCSSCLLSERQIMNGVNKIVDNHAKLCEISSRSLVTLAKWIQTDSRNYNQGSESEDPVIVGSKVREVLKIVNKYCSSFTQGLQHLLSPASLISEAELATGQLLQHSTYRCPSLGKTWFEFADWCYRWGRKVVEQDSSEYISLTDEERDIVISLLPDSIPSAVSEKCLSIISKPLLGKDTFTSSDDENSCQDSDTSEEVKLKKQLKSCLDELFPYDENMINGLASVWKSVLERAFLHYKQAAGAYFMYLQLSGDEKYVSDDTSTHSEYGNITASLRLLRLLVKYSEELRQHLEQPFKDTPTTPWKGIIPQLFARVNHPKTYVQKSVANLLCRIAKDSPELLVYSTVVGCSDIMNQEHLSKSTAAGILRAYQFQGEHECSQPIEEEIEVASQVDPDVISSPEDIAEISCEEKKRQSSFHVILDTLMEDNPSLVQEVKCVIQELRRITLLWDELWLGSLTQLHQEALRRISQLETEISRVQSNQTLSGIQQQVLIKEKHTALMKPLVYALERLQKITDRQPETPHEKSFQSSYADQINGAIELLKNPTDPSKPTQSWELAKQLYQVLQSRVQKRPLSNLYMENVSPCMSKRNFSLIPLPGIESRHDNNIITLTAFSDEIQVLPTKTKPKKLTMIGSDGQHYPYLFKGLEDLHLDERIMQFLEICNHMFAKADKTERKFIARHYSVTPLGPRSGLIQWVDRSMPLFTLYRRWQQRNAQAQALLKGHNDRASVPISPMRPTDLFYSKLNPLLKEKGIDINTSRKDWPIPILKKVLSDLSNETPNDLLRRELWCSSVHAADWWTVIKAFSRSSAVMSIIGYIIGLGDRHLDNILVDLKSGEVVHIDYNVCFEKGKILRVPEKVPFRMTPNIEAALGVTGIEGIFRNSCEVVMNALRQGHEVLLTLLEAFVYDPLIDWTTANDAAFAGAFYGGGAGADEGNKYSRKEMERGITQTLLSTRVAEMRVSWTKNRDELLGSLNNLKQSLNHYCDSLKHQWHSHEDVIMLKHQAGLLSAALINSDHPLHSLQSRYDKQAKLLADIKFWKQKLNNKLIECDQMCNQFKSIHNKVQGSYITNLYSEVCHLGDVGAPSYGPAVNFLNSAGQSNIVTQCEQIESELSSILNQRHCALRSCLESILSYSSIVNQFSSQYMKQHNLLHWMSLFSHLITEPTSAKCNEILTKHQDIVSRKNALQKEIEPLIISLENKLQQYFSEQNSRLIKLCDRRNTDPLETSMLSGPVTETWNALRKFVGDAGGAGATSLACVTITALSTLNKRQLVMENAAAVAGERLMHLTSRDGDWFLDELGTMCSNISQLLSVLKNNPLRAANQKSLISNDATENISIGMQVLFCSVKAYNSLQELMSNFRTIIVPEAIKSFLNNDTTVHDIIDAMKKMTESCPVELSVICKRYQKSFKEKVDLSDDIVNIVSNLRTNFEQLSGSKVGTDSEEGGSNVPHMTPGQMLLAGFSGLFTKVEGELVSLYDFARKLTIPDGSNMIDMNHDSKDVKSEDGSMLTKLTYLSTSTKWLNFLFIKKLMIINAFFEALLQQSNATREVDTTVNRFFSSIQDELKYGEVAEQTLCVFNEELLCLQVKQFIAEVVQYFIIGIPSQVVTSICVNYVGLLAPNVSKDLKEGKKCLVTMDELCKKVVDQSLKNNAFPHLHLSQASTLINAHDVAWRKHDLARRLDVSISSHKEIVQRAQLQVARFQWLHEDIVLNSRKRNQPLASPTKTSVINEIKKKLQMINQVEQGIPALIEKYSALQSSIEQRLKWGSGANPALNVVLQNFDEAVVERKSVLLNESKLIPEVCNLGNAIVKMETFQSAANESNVFNQGIVKLVQKCDNAFKAFESCMGDLGDVEQFMKSLHISIPPTEPITIEWMKGRLDMIDTQLKQTHSKETSLRNEIGSERENLKAQVMTVKASFTSHHGLVGEVKSMLKTLAKDEDAEECLKVRKFIQSHNKFSEDSSAVLKNILCICSGTRGDMSEQVAKLNEDDSAAANQLTDDLRVSVNSLHDQLLAFGSNSFSRIVDSNGSDTTNFSPVTSSKKMQDALQRDNRNPKSYQEKNLYALNVWKRVKLKLEGKDCDGSRRLGISEQVDYVIKEAMSHDNLCQLYEGWTPWV